MSLEGAGAALFELQPTGLALINWKARALHNCPDNVVAEAESAMLASELLTSEICASQAPVKDIFLQGDILPLVKHLAFAGRLRRIDLQPTVNLIRRKQARYSPMANGSTGLGRQIL